MLSLHRTAPACRYALLSRRIEDIVTPEFAAYRRNRPVHPCVSVTRSCENALGYHTEHQNNKSVNISPSWWFCVCVTKSRILYGRQNRPGQAALEIFHSRSSKIARNLNTKRVSNFAGQVYAPTHVERSLCVFGCNRATCSLRSEGWRVVRTQAPPPPREQPPETVRDENAPAVPTADNNSGAAVSMAGIMPPTPPGPSQEVRAPTTGVAWGESNVSWDDAAPGEDDEWGAELSEWGSGAATEGVGHGTAADIGALLDEREKLSSTARGGSALPTTAAVGGGVCGKSTSIGPRPDGASDGQVGPADASGPGGISSTAPSTAVENGDGGGRPCFPAKTVSFMPEPWGAESSGADDKDMKNRLRRYREQEEDRGLVAALDQALGLKESGVTGNSQQGLQGAGGGAASIGEKYERTPAR